ncbi:MAG TPA: TIGR03617 family F420-dependent LLM class oxidoreductase, partial [Acidimicrobiales bacterium]|nr:TIGR03617 family F420-dependent LLM class oxidoreductase [Acidimicrobiales bacterium]
AVQQFATDAQKAGVDGLVFTEGARTAYLSVAAAALAAPGLDLATGVAVAFPRSPMVTAQTAWELAQASAGRFRLGLGTQVRIHVERRYATAFDSPGPRLKEYVQAVKAIFRAFTGEQKLAFEGRYWWLSFMPAAWSPGPLPDDVSAPPVDVAAVNPWMWRMAGEVADGVHVHPLHSTSYLDEVAMRALREGAERAGRDASRVSLIVPVLAIVGDTEAEQEKMARHVRQQIGFYGSTPAYAFQFDRLGLDGLGGRLNALLKQGDFDGQAALLTDDVLAPFSVRATWDELPAALRQRYQGRADRLVSYLAQPMWQRDPSSLERWGDVATRLRQGTG